MVGNLRRHYQFVLDGLEARRGELEQISSADYLDNMQVGLQNWIRAADHGQLAWGIQHFRKPG